MSALDIDEETRNIFGYLLCADRHVWKNDKKNKDLKKVYKKAKAAWFAEKEKAASDETCCPSIALAIYLLV